MQNEELSPYQEERIKELNAQIKQLPNAGEISDGYHTFNELYYFRMLYNAALFNQWGEFERVNPHHSHDDDKAQPLFLPLHDVHKSWKHNDGNLCFGGGWFVVVAILPAGQITNHYPAEYWDLFKIPSVEKAKFAFDGHTAEDTASRILYLLKR